MNIAKTDPLERHVLRPSYEGLSREWDQDLTLLDALGSLTEDDTSWKDRGLCAQTDPDAFFPEKGESTREAKRICLSCEVRTQCLEYALDRQERFGIWGGASERERRAIQKERGTIEPVKRVPGRAA
ncbi:WhiB family transcriptional regulator [Amycolatopsis minnesotensis]|uniref:Transcriptional regulator WhiB n=1 Tax=Amycolatopsis minnesotensis TaxID=337894 RepID=A0ABN2SBG4_9PSEU